MPACVMASESVGDMVGLAAAAAALLLGGFGEAEVEDLDGAVGRDLDVGGLEVAVDDALLVRRFQPVGDLARVGDRRLDGQRALRGRRLPRVP